MAIGIGWKNPHTMAKEEWTRKDIDKDGFIGYPNSHKAVGRPISPWLASKEHQWGRDLNGDGRIGAGAAGYRGPYGPMSPYCHPCGPAGSPFAPINFYGGCYHPGFVGPFNPYGCY